MGQIGEFPVELGDRREQVQQRARLPAERPVVRAGRAFAEVAADTLPAGDSGAGAFACGAQVHAVVGVHGRDCLGVAPRCPHGVVGIPDGNVLARTLRGKDAAGLLSLSNLALVLLAVDPDSTVLVDCRPQNGPWGGEAPVDTVVTAPGGRELDRFDDVTVPRELGEHLACEHVPVPVEKCGPQFLRERFEVHGVLGVDVRVVGQLRRDEADGSASLVGDDRLPVVGGLDIAGLDGAVPSASRVGAGANPEDRDVGPPGPDPGLQEGADVWRGQRALVERQLLVLAALPAGSVLYGLRVPEHQQRAVREPQFVVGAVPCRPESCRVADLGELCEQRLLELPVGPPEGADTDPRVTDAVPQVVHEQRTRLAPAGGSAVQNVVFDGAVELLLLRRRCVAELPEHVDPTQSLGLTELQLSLELLEFLQALQLERQKRRAVR
ncbi:hypothetical protein ACIQVR_39660 [Streptomyces xanthochromogenes]|uniref:hypothetical protein n=1 Tax=Streptomyces xanthochromogenes TaxID=67384 RepID=UPI0037FF9F60